LIVSILCNEKPNRIHAFESGDKKAKNIFFENRLGFLNNIKDKKRFNKFATLRNIAKQNWEKFPEPQKDVEIIEDLKTERLHIEAFLH